LNVDSLLPLFNIVIDLIILIIPVSPEQMAKQAVDIFSDSAINSSIFKRSLLVLVLGFGMRFILPA